MLKYNIDFEIMGMIMMIIITYFFNANYIIRNRSDEIFRRMIYFILGAQFFDIVTAITFSMENPKLNLLNLILNTVYYMFAAATSVEFEGYITSYIDNVSENKIYNVIRKTIFTLYVIHGLLNPITKTAFYFDSDGVYQHGALYFLGYIIPSLYILSGLFHIIRYKSCFERKQWISCVSFIAAIFIAMILQAFIIPNIYLTYALIPLSVLTLLLSLETPDYQKLMHTLDELENAKQDAWHANHVKSEFLANMSHEIRTPINSILGFDEMILRESKDADTIKYATNIKRSGQSLLTIINDILDFSKIEAGKMDIIPQEYDVVEMVNNVIKMISPRVVSKNLKLNIEIDSKIPRKLYGDDVRITQVLVNLLTNAVKYTQQGEITFLLKAEKPFDTDVTLLFAVKDTGVGIKEESTQVLFSEFSRAADSDIHRIEGTGLGLPISNKFLNLMGSKLEVNSTYGEGSVFFFFLKQKIIDFELVGDFKKAMTDIHSSINVFREEFTAPDARILVVDDVDMNLKVFRGLLKKSLIQIDTASSGFEAIDMIRTNTYDCIFMDHQMPDMDGIETFQKLREDPDIDIANTPVIALTANAISGARETYLKAGFSDYLAKPINGWELSALLQKHLPAIKIQEAPDDDATAADKNSSADSAELPKPSSESNTSGLLDIPIKEADSYKASESVVPDKAAVSNSTKSSGISYSTKLQQLEKIGVDVKSGLSYTTDDEDFYLELVGDYVNDSENSISSLNDFYNKKDWHNYKICAHSLKNTSKTIGLNNLSEESKLLEYASRDEDIAFIEKSHESLISHLREAVSKISDIIQ